jgi:hypothetical protein
MTTFCLSIQQLVINQYLLGMIYMKDGLSRDEPVKDSSPAVQGTSREWRTQNVVES